MRDTKIITISPENNWFLQALNPVRLGPSRRQMKDRPITTEQREYLKLAPWDGVPPASPSRQQRRAMATA